VLGTFATAGLVAAFAHWTLGLGWLTSGLLAAAVSPTDPAVMFSVFGDREIGGRTGTILEGESGANDPVGIALMLGLIQLATHANETFWVVVRVFCEQMGIGLAIGIAGGPEKARDLTELYRYDVAIDYKSDDVGEALRHERVDVYFDNVGGEISQAVERRLNLGARIVVCGQVSQYNAQRPEPTFHPGLLVVFRARMEGFLVFDYAHRYDEAALKLAHWVANGDIRWREDVTEGLENAPQAFIGMLNGENQGKALVKVAERA
jgi:hypothetical protein